MSELIGVDQLYYRKGFGLKSEVESELRRAYHSDLVDRVVQGGHTMSVDGVTIRLAREFGNCYGVDRAVQYAYETRKRFPDRRIFLTGELIHNPHVNRELLDMGVGFLEGSYAGETTIDTLVPEDVVLLPAFGAPTDIMRRLGEKGCVLVDTTCGSVLLVWKTVEKFARDGFTSVIHGKWYHEETRATASRALEAGGAYLVVRDLDETALVTRFVREGGDVAALEEKFRNAMSPGFGWDRDLKRVGVANQTTMLMRETEEVAEELRKAMADRYGAEHAAEHVRVLDTICSATQERQDAVEDLLQDPPDIMIVLGGYNSSNTNNLARICERLVPATYHIDDPSCLESGAAIRHKPFGVDDEIVTRDWLPEGPVDVGLTAGASTPNNKTGETIERLLACRGLAVPA